MASVYEQDVPPSLVTAYRKVLGPPKLTGFALYVGSYFSYTGTTVGRRFPFRMPTRQGFTGRRITPAQTTQRQHFRAALDIYHEQPYFTPTDPVYGPKGHNIWWDQGASFNLYGINYFMRETIPHEIAGTPAPWDASLFLNIMAGQPGDQTGYQDSAPLPAGTYRVTMLESSWYTEYTPNKYSVAATIYRKDTSDAYHGQGPIGDTDPSMNWEYSILNTLYNNAAAAWTGYLNDSLHTYRDVVIAEGERIAVQYRNWKPAPTETHHGTLYVQIQLQP